MQFIHHVVASIQFHAQDNTDSLTQTHTNSKVTSHDLRSWSLTCREIACHVHCKD